MNPNKLIYSILFLLLLTRYNVYASTIMVAGHITSNTTWTADTVKITGDVTIDYSYTLTINAGTYVEAQGYYTISVIGVLIAVGAPGDSIIFTVNDTTGFSDKDTNAGGWGGINLGSLSRIQYCKIQFGKKILGDGGGIFCSGNPVIKNNLFQYNNAYHGGAICYAPTATINTNFSENVLKSNHGYG